MSAARNIAWLALGVSIVLVAGFGLAPVMAVVDSGSSHSSSQSPPPSSPPPFSHLQQNWDKSSYGGTPLSGCKGVPSGDKCFALGTVLTWTAVLDVCTSSTSVCDGTTQVSITMNNATALLPQGETYVTGTQTSVTIPSFTPTFSAGVCSSPGAPDDCSAVPSTDTYLWWVFPADSVLDGFPQANFTYQTTLTQTGTFDDTDVAHYTVNGFQENPPAYGEVYVIPNTPTVTTSVAPSGITLSAGPTPSAADTATLAGGYFPTGTLTFYAYYSSTSTPVCTDLVFTSTPVTVSGNGAYTSPSFTPTSAGYYFWTAAYSGDSNNTAVTTACGASGETLSVTPATPTVTTSVSPPTIQVGSSTTATDTATISGGYHPTGTITFYAYYSSSSTPVCTDLVFTSTPVTVSGNGAYTSPSFTPTAAGYYFWTAAYSGDSNNTAVTTACGASETETLSVAPATPTVSTSVSPSTIQVGSSTSATDTATLSGGYKPTGTITFYVYYSSTSTPVCTDLVFTSAPVSVSGNGAYPSGPYTPSTVGYYFWTAAYSGDANNTGVTTGCGASGETLSLTPAMPTGTTSVSPSAITLSPGPTPSAADTATISGGDDPTGTLTFHVYYSTSSTPVCTDLVYTSPPVTVKGDGAYTSSSITPAVAGYFFWTASYSGDANNTPFVTPCGAAGETLSVSPASPSMVTSVSPTTITLQTSPASAADTATLSGGYNPTGSITFYVYYSPTSTPVCTDGVFASSPVTVTGNGAYTSSSYTPTVVGYYFWVANYSGDSNNLPFTTACGASGETLDVVQQVLTVTTQVSPSAIMLSPTGKASSSATDTATISGGFAPTGTITFYVYYNASSTPLCTDLVFTSTPVTVSGDGSYTSQAFTPTEVGYYFFVANYSGDPNNAPFTTPCGAAGETLTVTQCGGPSDVPSSDLGRFL